jgi:hypothetical protein
MLPAWAGEKTRLATTWFAEFLVGAMLVATASRPNRLKQADPKLLDHYDRLSG